MKQIWDSFTEMFPYIIQRETWIVWLLGILCSILVSKKSKILKKDMLRHPWMEFICIMDIIVLIILLFFRCSMGWYLLILLPWLLLIWRWWKIKRKKSAIKKADQKEKDKNRYNHLEYLLSIPLFKWEIKYELLPAMNILYEIGALNKLQQLLDNMKQYENWYEYKRLKSYLCFSRNDYQGMIEILRPLMDNKDIPCQEYDRTVLNLYCAYKNMNDKENQEEYIKKIEKMIIEDHRYSNESLHDLFYYYDVKGNTSGIEKLKMIINGIKCVTFYEYLSYCDHIYYYNRCHGLTEANCRLIDQMKLKAEMMTKSEEENIRFALHLLKIYFENNYQWEAYSLQLFHYSEVYLGYSQMIAFEYMETVFLILQNTDMVNQIHVPYDQRIRLFSTIYKYINKYLPEFDKELTLLNDNFLYRKKEMLMKKVTFIRIKEFVEKDRVKCTDAIFHLEKQIIDLCDRNGDEREMLHFMVVLIDDFFELVDSIEKCLDRGVSDVDIKNTQAKIPVYKKDILCFIDIIRDMLHKYNFNQSQAYYILFVSYFYYRMGKKDESNYLFYKFEDLHINVRHYTLAVQDMYQKLKVGLGRE